MSFPRLTKRLRQPTALAIALLLAAFAVMLRWDLAQVAHVAALAAEGSPPPARDPHSPTGYVLGQRNFVAPHARGETYRWIAAAQDWLAAGAPGSRTYDSDTVPTGRPRLEPRLETAWLAGIAWGLHFVRGEPTALAAEQVAGWEPVVAHVLAFLLVVWLVARAGGPVAAGLAGWFFVLFPPVAAQFLPGVLTSRTGALLLAGYAIALHVFPRGGSGAVDGFSRRAAVAAAAALWLDPAFGFAAVLITLAVGVTMADRLPVRRGLVWAATGAGLALIAWWIDGAHWAPAAGELRYVHPLYAVAWLGGGLALDGWSRLRTRRTAVRRAAIEIAAGLALGAVLAGVQISRHYAGWLYPSAELQRLTSLDETRVYRSVGEWMVQAPPAEVVWMLAPLLVVAAVLVFTLVRKGRDESAGARRSLVVMVVVFVAVLALTIFRVRWGVVGVLVTLPMAAALARPAGRLGRGLALSISVVFLCGLTVWHRHLPPSLRLPAAGDPTTAADVEALVYRHLAHWLASHNPGQPISALAPPELSDSLVFHGGCRVLMSTAWESYPGQVAASRVLSALEFSEAQAVIESRQLTHVILPSWDKILPLLVREPETNDKEALYPRLRRWIFPPDLRPMPYRLPATPGYGDQTVAVFKVVPVQDEALSLSRLGEYFLEVNRPEPAGLVAQVLARSYPDDPNAAITRALVAAGAGQTEAFEHELERVAAEVKAGRTPDAWDRRVQRAIVLALGHRTELARTEVEACVAGATRDDLFALTPLEAYRLRTLAGHFGVTFADPANGALLAELGAEFSPAR